MLNKYAGNYSGLVALITDVKQGSVDVNNALNIIIEVTETDKRDAVRSMLFFGMMFGVILTETIRLLVRTFG